MKQNEVMRLLYVMYFFATEVVLLEKLGRNEVVKTTKQWVFEESGPELDHAGDIDYVAKFGDKAISVQIKHVTWLQKSYNRKLIDDEIYEDIKNDSKNLSVKINNFLSFVHRKENQQRITIV